MLIFAVLWYYGFHRIWRMSTRTTCLYKCLHFEIKPKDMLGVEIKAKEEVETQLYTMFQYFGIVNLESILASHSISGWARNEYKVFHHVLLSFILTTIFLMYH